MTALITADDLLHEIDEEDLLVLDVQYTLTGDCLLYTSDAADE